MALIKCPECGKEISDTCQQCIHCGYSLSEKKSKNKETTLIYRERMDKTLIMIELILGIIFVPVIAGIFIILIAIHDNEFIDKNNCIPNDIAYYDYDTKKIVFYTIDGRKIIVDSNQIEKIKYKGYSLFVKCPEEVELGICSKGSKELLENYIESIKNGTFEDVYNN